ncbi:MAG: tetratricopeptide repeat protein [Candidatus Kapabacteria bacterium]|nr:tetratricopeptide repeat protein [Candidatus Kapabacteria bacterium]
MTPEDINASIEKLKDLVNKSQNQEAKSFAEELIENKAIQEDPNSLAKVCSYLGAIYSYLSDCFKAIEYYEKSLHIYEKRGNKGEIANNLGNIGIVYQILSDYPKALEYFSKALKIFEEIGNKNGIARNFGNIGSVKWYLSEYPNALEFYSKALLINEEIGNKGEISGNLVNIGNVFKELSDYQKALEFYGKALLITEEIGHKQFQANALGNIGTVYANLSDYQKALEYFHQTLHINKEIGNKNGIASNLGNIGVIYKKLSDYPKALEYYSKALHINEESRNNDGIATNLGNIGNVYKELSDDSQALEFYSKALQISQVIGRKNTIAKNLGNIGSVYSTKESAYYDTKKAEEYLQKSLLLAEEIGAKDIIKDAYEHIHTLRQNEMRFEESLEYHKKFVSLEKEIQTIEAKKQADNFHLQRKLAEQEIKIAEERGKLLGRESILRNILPDSVTDRLVKGENPIADHFETASVLFMDLVGFTTLASIAPPKQLVFLLDAIFQKADEVVETFGLEKIKTIGDGYLAVANVTTPLKEHQKATALAALQLLETMKDFVVNIPSDLGATEWIKNMNNIEIRIGIHTGEVVAGIIGKNKYTYDLWGDAVNVASRMESNSEAGRIHISEQFAKSIESHQEFSLIPRGEISIKGKGTMNTFWLEKGK